MQSRRTAAIRWVAAALEEVAAQLAPPQSPLPGDVQLLLAEYSSLREEVKLSLQAQQQVLTWSLATFGVFFAGGLALAASDAANEPGGLRDLPLAFFCLVFGLALPGAITAAAAAWLGELARMERVNRYIRGVELLVAEHYGVSAAQNQRTPGIFRWETYLATKADDTGENAKQSIGYLGGAALYFGAFLVSQAIFLIATLSHTFAAHGFRYHVAAVVGSTVALGMFLRCTLVPGQRIRKMPGLPPLALEDFNPRRQGA